MRAGPRAPPSFGTLVEASRWRAAHQPGRLAYRFLPSGEPPEAILTYGELDRRARVLAARLQSRQRRGDRVLVVCPPGLEFVVAYFGCLYAGAVAVVLPPPVPSRLPQFLARLAGICRDATPAVALATARILDVLRPHFAQAQDPIPIQWLPTDDQTEADASGWHDPQAAGSDLAFLQYTSGSTTEPKGVMVSHGNLVAQHPGDRALFAQPPDTESVCWLPPHHDMGLIGGILAPALPRHGCHADAIRRVRPAAGPLAAGDLPLPRERERRSQLRLRSLPSPDHTRAARRHSIFAPGWWLSRARSRSAPRRYGRSRALRALRVSAGGLQAVLRAGGGHPDGLGCARAERHPSSSASAKTSWRAISAVPAAEDDVAGAALVSSGRPAAVVAIVNPESGTTCDPGEIGEIWVSGPSVALGYWNRPEETAATFGRTLGSRPETFLRTGDLGFLLDGRALRHRPAQGPDHHRRREPLSPGYRADGGLLPPGARAGSMRGVLDRGGGSGGARRGGLPGPAGGDGRCGPPARRAARSHRAPRPPCA